MSHSRWNSLGLGAVVFLAALAGTQLGQAGFTPLQAGYANRVNGGAGDSWLTTTLKDNGQPDRVVMYDAKKRSMMSYVWHNASWQLTSIRNCTWDLMVREYPSPDSSVRTSNGKAGSIKKAVLKLVERTSEWESHLKKNKYDKDDVKEALEQFALKMVKESGSANLFTLNNGAGHELLCVIDRDNERALIYELDKNNEIQLVKARQLTEDFRLADSNPLQINISDPMSVDQAMMLADKRDEANRQN